MGRTPRENEGRDQGVSYKLKTIRDYQHTAKARSNAWNSFSLPALRKSPVLSTPLSWTSSLQNCKIINFVVHATRYVVYACLSWNFRISLSISSVWDFDWFLISLGRMYVNNIMSSDPWTWYIIAFTQIILISANILQFSVTHILNFISNYYIFIWWFL